MPARMHRRRSSAACRSRRICCHVSCRLRPLYVRETLLDMGRGFRAMKTHRSAIYGQLVGKRPGRRPIALGEHSHLYHSNRFVAQNKNISDCVHYHYISTSSLTYLDDAG